MPEPQVSGPEESLVGRRVSHYLLSAPLGKGGMGTVFLGQDLTLQRFVALKVLRGEYRLDAEAKARFLREARILSQLKHPHVCVVHDYLEAGDEDFIVLELVEGRSLRRAMADELAFGQKLRIALQLAEVLAAVHARDVIHRDLKPENVMLTPEGDIKVLDFGLARSVGEETHDLPASLLGETLPPPAASAPGSAPARGDAVHTTAGAVLGTLGYMSPEQARGAPATSASDLYSYGLILQELFAGRPAFDRGLPPEHLLARAAAGEKLEPEGLDPAMSRLIADLTRFEPERRIDAPQALKRLRWIAAGPGRRRRRWVAATLALAALSVAAFSAWIASRVSREDPLVPPGVKGRVALLRFRNDSGDPSLAWVERGLRGMVGETLAGADPVEVIPVERVDRAVAQVVAAGANAGDVDLQRLTQLLGAEVAVAARFVPDATGVAVEYRTASRSGSGGSRRIHAADAMAAAEELADRLLRRLAPERAFGGIRETFSGDPFANRLYAMATSAYEKEGAEAARDLFRAALRLDSDFDWARIGLADCADRLSEWDEEERQAGIVEKRARDSRNSHLLAATLTRLSSAAIHKLDFDAAEKQANEALILSRRDRDTDREADALFQLGDVAKVRERWQDAERFYSESLELHRRQGDRIAEVLSLHAVGFALAEQDNHIEEASRQLEQALALERELKLRPFEAMSLNSLAAVRRSQKRFDEAEKMFQQALALYREFGNRSMEASVLSNLAVLEQDRGRWRQAIAHLEESYASLAAIGDDEGRTSVAFNLAYVYARTGQLAPAEKYLALARARYAGDWETIWLEARLAWVRGDRESAHKLLDQARKLAGDAFEPGLAGAELTTTVELD